MYSVRWLINYGQNSRTVFVPFNPEIPFLIYLIENFNSDSKGKKNE